MTSIVQSSDTTVLASLVTSDDCDIVAIQYKCSGHARGFVLVADFVLFEAKLTCVDPVQT